VTLMPFLTRMSGLIYLAAALALNAGFLYYALALQITAREELPMRVFRFSVTSRMWLFAALLLDHYLPTLRGGGPVAAPDAQARHSVPFAVHTAGWNRKVCAMGALWRARQVWGYVAR